ncbi:DUF4245 family protein [Flexivirga caeni]|uniref:DUF4245 family protein n=1 Tax=Flexivirga caeni TaxID=2294115 RepID=UPI0013150D21|nr:DUF4245 family protein [Flexivirga caeni]
MNDTSTPTGLPSATPEPAAGPPPRRRGMGSTRSMVISMVIVAFAVVGWWAFVPRSTPTAQPVADVAGIAREIGISRHWDPAVADGLPSTWSPVNVRLVTLSDQPPTWQAGYDVPGGKYIRVLQTANGNTSWVQAQTGNGAAKGIVTIGGVVWSKVERADGGERSLIRSAPLGGLSTVVDGTGSWSQLIQFAASVKPLSKSALATKGPTTAPSS